MATIIAFISMNKYISASAFSLASGLNSLGVSQQQAQAGSPGKEQEKER